MNKRSSRGLIERDHRDSIPLIRSDREKIQ